MASASKTVGKKTWTGDETLNRNGDGAISTPVLVFTDAESRDDLYSLGVVSSAADAARPKTADSKAGAMPTRRKPHLADFALESPPIAHTSKPESFDLPPTFVNNPYPVVGIGLALGSPSQSPWIYDEVAARSVSTLDTRGNSPLNTPASVHGNGLEDGAKDKGRRKMFGSLFAKKPVSHPVSPAAPFYKAQYPKSANQVQPYLPSNLSAPSRHRRVTSRSLDNIHGSTIAKSKPTTWTPVSLPPRPSLKKAPSAPIANKIRSPTPPPKDYPTRPVTAAVVTQEPPQPPQADLLLPQDQMQKPSSNLKLLEINIPDVSMERYSIMFSDVLKPRQSLLARRQAHLPQLKMDNDSRDDLPRRPENHIPVRRATVPSPTYSLFPLPPSHKASPSPLQHSLPPLPRSATAPSVSPANASRPVYPKRQDSRVRPSVHTPSQSSDTPVTLNDQWQSDCSPISTVASEEDHFNYAHDSMPSIRRSESGSRSQAEDIVATVALEGIDSDHELAKLCPAPLKTSPRLLARENQIPKGSDEPHSQGLNIPHKNLPAIPVQRKASTPNLSSSHTAGTFRELVKPNPLKSSPASATEISVARKLSLSRRQQMLVPIVPKAVQRPQQPKLINPDDLPEAPPLGRKTSTSRPREKSQYIVLDSV